MFASEIEAAAYLAGIIDGEGCVRFAKYGRQTKREVRITNTERALIDASVDALERLGIDHIVRYRSDRECRANVFGVKPLWDIIIARRAALEQLAETVTLRHPEKAAKLRAAVESYPPRKPVDELGRLYAGGMSIREAAETVGMAHSTAQYHLSRMDLAREPGRPRGRAWSDEERVSRTSRG